MIQEAKNVNHETRSMSVNAFGAADIKFQELANQVGNSK
jgi:hypothetical protein